MKEMLLKNKKTTITLLVLAVVALILGQKTYYALLIALCGIYAIVATSLDILFGYTGQISLGHAGIFAIGSYATALLTLRCGIPTLVSLILGSIIAMLMGILIAIPASKLVKHFLSLLMIAFGQIVYLVVNSWTPVTGGSLGIMDIPHLNLFGLVLDSNLKNAIFVWILLAIILVLKKRTIDSRVGRSFIAIRENAVAARGLGIDVRKYKVLAFAISALLTGLAGGLYAYLRNFISPETFNGTQSTLFMTMLLFGGITTMAGPVIGASILMVIREVFQSFALYQGVIYALSMLLVLFFFPNGIVGVYGGVKRMMKNAANKRKDKAQGGDMHAEN